MVADLLIKISPFYLLAIILSFIWLFISILRIIFYLLKNNRKLSPTNLKWIVFPASILVLTFFLIRASSFFLLSEVERLITMNANIDFNKKELQISQEEFASAFKQRFYFKDKAGSSPTKSIIVNINSHKKPMNLILKEDSRDKQLFWVSIAGYMFDSKICFIKLPKS